MESLGVDLWKLVAQVVAFIIFLVVLWRYAAGPIVRVLDERAARAVEGMQAAQEMQVQLEATASRNEEVLAEARRDAQQIIAEARAAGDAALERAREEASRQSDEYMARAEATLRAQTEQARQELRQEVADLAVLAAGQIVRKELDPESQARLIEQTLADAAASRMSPN